MGSINVNGAEIHHEVRGSDPPVLFIQGATGDGGTFERVASLLAGEFTVVTYDQRGNSRSPRRGVEMAALTGAHTPYLGHPEEMAQKIRQFLRQVNQPGQSALLRATRRR